MTSPLTRLLAAPLATALAALALATSVPSAAAAVVQQVCLPALSATASGDVYGAGSCTSDVVTVYRRAASATAFRAVTTAWRGFRAVDVADDGASTFVLLHCQDLGGTCQASDPLVGRFAVAKLPHGGRPSAVTLLGDGQGGGGSIAAADGRWVAAYAAAEFRREEDDRAYSRIEVRGTAVGGRGRALLLPEHPDATPEPYLNSPAVALTPSGPVFAYLARDSDDDPSPELRTAAVDRAGTITTAPYGPAAGAAAGPPAVAVAGGRTFVAWSRAGRLALAHDGVRQDLPTRGTVGTVTLAASGGRAFLLDDERFAYAGGTTSRVYLRTVTLGGSVLATTELSSGQRSPTVQAGANDVTASQGRPTASFDDGTRNVVTSP